MLELDYCVPNGIPFSEFRSWSTVDRDMALSWLVRKMEECPACHTRGKEWDPRQGGHHHAYVPQVRGCEGCIATSRGEKAEAETLKAVAGRRIVLVPNPMLRPRRSGLWRGQ